MKKSHEVLKEAIDPIGVKQVASELGVSHSLVYKWCERSEEKEGQIMPSSGTANPLDRLRVLYESTKSLELISWICQIAGGSFVHNLTPADFKEETQVIQSIQKLIQEFSETLNAISESYYQDHSICEKDSNLIRKEWEDLKRIGEGFVRACEAGHLNK